MGIETIQTRVRCLTRWMLERLLELRHSNGRLMVRIYGPVTMEGRGGTVTMNVYDANGRLLDYRRVEELASQERISLRTGCFCNPGAGETAEGLSEADMAAALRESADMTLPRFVQFVTHRSGKSAGALRVSLGLASNFADVYRLVRFVEGLRDQTRMTVGDADVRYRVVPRDSRRELAALARTLEDVGGADSPHLTPHRRRAGPTAGAPRPHQPARLPPQRASPSGAGARHGAPPVRRPACRPASSTIAAAPPPAT